MTSFSFICETPLDLEKFQTWFGELLQSKRQDILRSRGILEFNGGDERCVLQSVHMLMSGSSMDGGMAGRQAAQLSRGVRWS